MKLGSTDATIGISDLRSIVPSLRIFGGDRNGEMLRLKFPKTTFGRPADNDFAIEGDVAASTEHCSIKLENGVFRLTDLRTNDGTLVNGEHVETFGLKEGDMNRIGSPEWQLTLRLSS